MTHKVNGMLGDWAAKRANAKPIAVEVKASCLELFRQGASFHRAASALGLRPYTVRGWYRKFRRGNESWATGDGWAPWRASAAENLVQCRHEVETFVPIRGENPACDRSRIGPRRPFTGGEDQVAGGSEPAAAVPLYSADGACERILAGGLLKKKEIAAVRSLIDSGHSVKEACLIAGIPRCAYYRARKPSEKAESDSELVRLMCDIENDRHVSSTYGLERLTGEVNNRLRSAGPEIVAKILRSGTRVNRKRIHRLMKEHDIHSRIRRRRQPDSYYKAVKEMLRKNRAPNILRRSFTAERPMARLTTDVTYIPCSDQKFIYLSPLFDLFNHEIRSYSVSTVNSEEFVRSMLTALPPEALKGALIHNDQGSVYWSNGWVELCERLQVVRSMSRRGNCWDNALSEQFFSAMKTELGLTKREYKSLLTTQEVKDLINDYIPWYNAGRIQKRLGYLSPVQFKEAFLDKSKDVTAIVQTCKCKTDEASPDDASGACLGPSARPFGDGTSPTHRQGSLSLIDSNQPLL